MIKNAWTWLNNPSNNDVILGFFALSLVILTISALPIAWLILS